MLVTDGLNDWCIARLTHHSDRTARIDAALDRLNGPGLQYDGPGRSRLLEQQRVKRFPSKCPAPAVLVVGGGRQVGQDLIVTAHQSHCAQRGTGCHL
jgi:hypothetical protein